MKFMAKLDGSLTGDTVHRLLASPQWAEAESLLPTDPRFVADCRQALADNLSLPCPEEPPFVAPEDLDLMQHYLHALNPDAAPIPSTENCLLKREKGGKKPKKTVDLNDNHKEYQSDIPGAKNSGKSPRCPGRPPAANPNLFPGTRNPDPETPAWVRALDEGRLDINTLHAIGAGRPIDLDLSRCSVPA
jgi:hypothetical protein